MQNTKDINRLEGLITDAAFLLGQEAPKKDIHSKLVQALVIVEGMKVPATIVTQPISGTHSEVPEINKVKRKLKLWAKRPEQINHKILKAFLKLRREGAARITEEELSKSVKSTQTFRTNFQQMKTISEKNHAKVFDQIGDEILIWAPVESYVKEFETETLRLYGE